MRREEYDVGNYVFQFHYHNGSVAVDVKCHLRPEPRDPRIKQAWAALTDDTRWALEDCAIEGVREWWWDNAAEELPAAIEQAGRSGGYLVFSSMSEDLVSIWAEEAAEEACGTCRHGLTPKVHRTIESLHSQPSMVLPIPDAPWDIECDNCGEPYSSHVSNRCPVLIGYEYAPHRYKPLEGDSYAKLKELEGAVTLAESLAEPEKIQTYLDGELEHIVLSQVEDNGPILYGQDSARKELLRVWHSVVLQKPLPEEAEQ